MSHAVSDVWAFTLAICSAQMVLHLRCSSLLVTLPLVYTPSYLLISHLYIYVKSSHALSIASFSQHGE